MAIGIVGEGNKMLIAIMIVAFIASAIFQVNVMYIILISIGIGLVQTFFQSRKEVTK